MSIDEFEAMIARAEFVLEREYEGSDGQRRRKYKSPSVPYPISIAVEDGEVDEWDALKIEVILDEEGYFGS